MDTKLYNMVHKVSLELKATTSVLYEEIQKLRVDVSRLVQREAKFQRTLHESEYEKQQKEISALEEMLVHKKFQTQLHAQVGKSL